MDMFSCRDEYDFCNKFAAEILRGTDNRFEEWKNIAGEFITRLMPKISYSPDGINAVSVSLGITPKTHKPEEVFPFLGRAMPYNQKSSKNYCEQAPVDFFSPFCCQITSFCLKSEKKFAHTKFLLYICSGN